MNSVALVKYEESLEQSLAKGLDLIDGLGQLKSPVLIKPNICTVSDNTGHSVTHASLVEAIIRLVLKTDDSLSIRIVETDSQSKFAEEAYQRFGYAGLEDTMRAEGFDVSLVNLSKSPLKQITFDGLYFKDPELPDLVTKENSFISVAVAKTHYLTTLTGSLKNQFGLLPRKDQAFYHRKIADVIVDLNRIVQPDLCVIDARVGVEGWNGPKTREIGAFILGKKPVSVDAAMAQIMGFRPEEVPHIFASSKYNLGVLNPEIIGESIDSLKAKFKIPK